MNSATSMRNDPTARSHEGTHPLRVRAFALGTRIELRDFRGDWSALGAVLLPTGGGQAILYRFGCVVLFNVSGEDGARFLATLSSSVRGGFDEPSHEEAEFTVAETIAQTPEEATERQREPGLLLGDENPETLQVVGDALAKSVALEHYERHIALTFEQLEPLTSQLAKTGKTARRSRVLVQHIASSLLAEHDLTTRIEVAEKPDLLWDHPRLERLHAWLVQEYELKERQAALERKLHLLSRTAEVLLDLLQTRRSLRVEWYIVGLIVLEVVLMLFFESH